MYWRTSDALVAIDEWHQIMAMAHVEASTQVMLTKLTSRTGSPIRFIWACTDKVRSSGKAEVSAASIVHSTSIGTWKEEENLKFLATI